MDEVLNPEYVISRNVLAYHNGVYSDDSTLMMLNLLKLCDVKRVYLAGFDGLKKITLIFMKKV